MKQRWLPLALIALTAFATADDRADRLRRDVETLADFGGRLWGSEEGRNAAEWIAGCFAEIGLLPDGQEGWFQFLPAKGQNVLAFLPPTEEGPSSDEYILVGAHYDHLGWSEDQAYRGADDNASGVAALLEVARSLSLLEKRQRGVVFCSFDAEEWGLVGSRHLAANPLRPLEDCVGMICLDMLGRSLIDALPGCIFAFGAEWSSCMADQLSAASEVGGSTVLSLATEYVGPRSDFFPFALERVPFLFLTTGTHDDYHTPRDLPDQVDYDGLATHTCLLEDLLRRLIAGPAPSFDGYHPDGLAEAGNIELVARRLLEERSEAGFLELWQLKSLHRLAVRVVDRGVAPSAWERFRLVTQTQLLMLSTMDSKNGMQWRIRRVLNGLGFGEGEARD